MKAKNWQVALIVLGLLVGGGLIVYNVFGNDPTDLNQEFYLLDPMDGELYHADWRKVRFSIPAAHPETGEARLVRLYKIDGRWRVIDRDMAILERLPPEQSAAVNLEDGSLKNQPKAAKEYRPKSNE